VKDQELGTPRQVVDDFAARFFSVTLDEMTRQVLANYLAEALGTRDVLSALSYAEEPLRKLLHQMLSLPEYQLG
jgi:hypothetical protein